MKRITKVCIGAGVSVIFCLGMFLMAGINNFYPLVVGTISVVLLFNIWLKLRLEVKKDLIEG